MNLHPALTNVTPLSKRIALILFIALPFIGFFCGIVYTRNSYEQELSAAEEAVATAETRARARVTSDNPIVPLQDELASCIENTEKQAVSGGVNYEKGTILVSFNADVSFSSALEIIEDYYLKTSTSADTEQNYENQKWLTVRVPKDEEFRWICILKGDQSVKYTGLNQIFSLHE